MVSLFLTVLLIRNIAHRTFTSYKSPFPLIYVARLISAKYFWPSKKVLAGARRNEQMVLEADSDAIFTTPIVISDLRIAETWNIVIKTLLQSSR